MKVLFTPLSIVAGLAAGQIAAKTFTLIWSRIDKEDAPHPKHREIDGRKLVVALLVEGAIFRLVKGLTDHGLRHGYRRVAGSWPGDERPEPA